MLIRLFYRIMLLVLFSTSLLAETYTREYTYNASEADSKITSRTNAIDQVKTILLQEIGTHIRQKINITKDGAGKTYAREDVEAITAGLTKVEIIEETWNGETYYVKANIQADTTRVLNALKEFKNDNSEKNRKELEELKDNQRELKAAREEVAQLRKQLKHVTTRAKKENIAVKYIGQVDQISLTNMFNIGYNYDQQNKHEDAVYWYHKAAERGLASAQYSLGSHYYMGEGVKFSREKTAYWMQRASDQGHINAQHHLGVLYHSGAGVKQDKTKAIELWKKAARKGHQLAKQHLKSYFNITEYAN